MSIVKIGVCQMNVCSDKSTNLKKAAELITKASKGGANFVVLPEMFNCPYNNESFIEYAESEGGETTSMLSKLARDNGIYLIGGSIPELCDGNIYNTSYVYDKLGNMIGKHRKVHLFDIDVKNKIRFMESDTLTAGDKITVIDTEYGKIGVAICFDIRFVEQFRIMSLEGAKIVFVPGAFNMTTGPAHWELSFRVRAVDNQYFMVGCAPARNISAGYISYGNSIVVNPWGEILGRLDEKEDVMLVDVELDSIDSYREQIPILKNRRTDIYQLNYKKE